MPDVTLSQHFGVVIRNRRMTAGLSQEALAEKADLHPTYVSMDERGVRNPTLDVADRLARGLGADLPSLIQEAMRHRPINHDKKQI